MYTIKKIIDNNNLISKESKGFQYQENIIINVQKNINLMPFRRFSKTFLNKFKFFLLKIKKSINLVYVITDIWINH